MCKFHASIPEMAGMLLQQCFKLRLGFAHRLSSHRPLPHPQSVGMCEPQPGQSFPRLFIQIPRGEEFFSCPSDIGHLPLIPMERAILNGQQAVKDPDKGSWDPGEGGPCSLGLRLPWASGCYPGILSSKSFLLMWI